MIDCVCPICGIAFQRTLSEYNTTLKKGSIPHCSKKCVATASQRKRKEASGMTRERFFALISREPGQGPNGDCWEWQGARTIKNYGKVSWPEMCEDRVGHIVLCHRVSYTFQVGEIPEGLNVCHECDNPPCCNPAHLFVGTALDNNQDAVAKGRNAHGSKHYLTKLTEKDVEQIKLMQLVGFSHRDIAKKFSLTEDASYAIKAGRSWKKVCVDSSHRDYEAVRIEFEKEIKSKRTKKGHSKLQLQDATAIKSRLAEGHSYHDIAGEFNTSYETVIQIKNGIVWKKA